MKKTKITQQNIQELQNNYTGVTYAKWQYQKKRREAIFQAMMTENFPKLISDTKANIQEAQSMLGKINAKKKKKKLHVGISYSNFRKSNIKEKS